MQGLQGGGVKASGFVHHDIFRDFGKQRDGRERQPYEDQFPRP